MTEKTSDGGGTEREQYFSLRQGDVLEFWSEGSFVVRTVFLCREMAGNRTFEWRWMLLDDESLVEVSPDGFYRYRDHRVLRQGTSQYEEIVAQDGALVRFEERVRDSTSGRRPVHLTLEERTFRITSTGTVAVERLGDEPDIVPWASFSPVQEDNVYFGLAEVDVEDSFGLGLWTAHVSVCFGREFDPSEVTIYRAERK